MKKICILWMILVLMMALTACSDEYLSVVQDRTTQAQEVSRITMESDHLIRGYMVSQDGVATKIVQILEMVDKGQPYQVLVEIDPIKKTFVGFANLTGDDGEEVQAWQESLVGRGLSDDIPALQGSGFDILWVEAIEEAKDNVLFLVKD